MPTLKEQYSAALGEILNRYDRLDDQTIRRLVELLQDFRKSLAGEILELSDFEAFRLQQLRQSVDRLTQEFESQLNAAVRGAFGSAYRLGQDAVTEPLSAVGIQAGFNQVNPAQLNTALDFSAVLVKNIADEMRNRIDAQLRLAALGGESPFNVMRNITDILGVKARDGIWGVRNRPEVVKGIAARAEAITRTELTTIFNLSHHAQQTAAQNAGAQIMKRWIATGDRRTREAHLRAHRRYKDSPIPIDQPFIVGGEELQYPGDPLASASNRVNCRCKQGTVVADIGVVGTPLDARIAKELKRRDI
jgi:hypothetical protein